MLGGGCLLLRLSRAARCVALVAEILARLLAALFVDGVALLDARIVALELNARVLREAEHVLHDFAAQCQRKGCPARKQGPTGS